MKAIPRVCSGFTVDFCATGPIRGGGGGGDYGSPVSQNVPLVVPRPVPCDSYYTIRVEINIQVEVKCHVACFFLLRIQIACASFKCCASFQ